MSIKEQIKSMIEKASKSNADDALKLTQAALNAAQAVFALEHAKQTENK